MAPNVNRWAGKPLTVRNTVLPDGTYTIKNSWHDGGRLLHLRVDELDDPITIEVHSNHMWDVWSDW